MTPFTNPFSDAILQRFSQLLYRCFEEGNVTKAALYLGLQPGEAFGLVSHYGWPRHEGPPALLLPGDPLLAWIRRDRRAVFANPPELPPEFEPFRAGSDLPRFLAIPIYHRGDLIGLLLERDPLKGQPIDLVRDLAAAKPIIEAIAGSLEEFRLVEPVTRPTPAVPENSEPAPITVTVPPSSSVSPVHPAPERIPEAAVTQAEPNPEGAFYQETLTGFEDQAELLAAPRRRGLFLPEQRTYFWEIGRLLSSFLPLGAAALWVEDPQELRPMLLHSRRPLGEELKQQVLGALATHVPSVPKSALKLLCHVEAPDKEPLAGPFRTYLPLVLKEEEGIQDLLLLFRMEDRPFTPHEQAFLQHVARILGFHLQETRIHERYHRAFLSVSQRMLASTESRVPELKQHSIAIAKLARKLAVKLDLPAPEVEAVSIAAILHDVGTVYLDPELLAKPKFSDEDRARIQSHPMLSTSFLRDFQFPFDVLSIIRHHHERWDGAGYPDGLSGNQIPMGSRIIALAESFEVMSTGRSYKEPLPRAAVIEELKREAGRQFDPALVPVFLTLVQR